MGDYRAQSLSQRKKSVLKDRDKAAMCLSDGVLAWHADVPGLRPRIQGSRGHSTESLERTRATLLLSGRKGNQGPMEPCHGAGCSQMKVRSMLETTLLPVYYSLSDSQRPRGICPILLSFLSFPPSSHPFTSLANFLSSSAGSLLHPVDQLSDSDFLSFMLSSHSFIQI